MFIMITNIFNFTIMPMIQISDIILIACLASALGLDYIFTIQEEGPTACAGNENIFLDAYLDMSKLDWKQIDDETLMLQGYVIFLKNVDPNLHLHIEVKKLTSGLWIETEFQIDRPLLCMTLFDKYEIWYDFVKDLETSSNLCPPKAGTKYYFNDKKLSTLLKDLTPGMEGTYRALFKVFVAEKTVFCMVVEGYLVRKFDSIVQ